MLTERSAPNFENAGNVRPGTPALGPLHIASLPPIVRPRRRSKQLRLPAIRGTPLG
jgi:hypothetical protein